MKKDKETKRNDALFAECYKFYTQGQKSFWHVLSEKHGFSSEEALRSWFRRQLSSRGLLTKSEEMVRTKQARLPKVLLFDFETTDILFSGWRPGQQYVSSDQILQDWFILSYSAKWLGSGDAFGEILTPQQYSKMDDRGLIEKFVGLLNEADVVLAYNGKHFDFPVLNTRMAYWRMWPYTDKKMIDPLETLRSNFRLSSNKLEYVLKYFGLPPKTHAGRDLWLRIRNGDLEAYKKMLEYNINDAGILEELYVLLRPWMKNHPNLNVYYDTNIRLCPTCLSTRLSFLSSSYHTGMGRYKQYRCQDCGTVGRVRESEIKKATHPHTMKQIER